MSLILLVLIFLTFLLIKPILISIIIGFLLAFIFSPVYNFNKKYIKNRDLNATIITIVLILVIVIPLWFVTPLVLNQSLKLYSVSQNIDLVTPLRGLFPSLFTSDGFSSEIGSVLESFVSNATSSIANSISQFVLSLPILLLNLLVILFVFYFALRDRDKLVEYIKSVLPFPKSTEDKLFNATRDITKAVLYGQVVIGLLQGIIIGVGFFIFGVPNAIIFTLLAVVAGIFPIIGTMIIWGPIAVYLFLIGSTVPAIGVIIFGIISSNVDNFLRPLFVSRRTNVHSSIVLVGMIGGLFLFGIVGIVIGPLIMSYLLIVLELFKNKKDSSIL